MAIYRVQAPDGTILRVEGPDGARPEDVAAAAAQQYKSQPWAPMRKGPSRASSFIKGARDVVDAGAQLAVRGANAIGLAPDSEVARVEGINKEAERDFQENWGGNQVEGFDGARLLGTGVVGGAAMAPAKVAGTLAGRIGQGMKMGAGGGALTQVEDPKSGADFAVKKAAQIGVGGMAGGAGVPIVEMGAQGIANIAAKALGRGAGAVQGAMGRWTDDAAAKIARESLRRNGTNFDALSKGVQRSILDDVKEALQKYGGVDKRALAREADFKDLGIDPLKAWVTRDPVDFGKLKNLEATDAGDVLKRARAGLDKTLLERLEALRGPSGGSAYQAGNVAGEALSTAHKSAQTKTTALYDAFRKTAPNVSADPKRLVDTALDSVEKDALGDFLSPGLRNLVNDFASGKRPTTPDSLYRAQQVATAEVRKGGNEGRAARKIVEAIDNELEQMGRDMSAVGPEMAQASALLKKARESHRSLKMAEEAIPALKAVAEGTFQPEEFLSRYIVGGNVNEVATMWSKVKSPQLRAAARSQIVDALKDAARGKGQSDEAATFAQARFSQFLGAPGMREKLAIILGNGGMKQVEQLRRVAESAIKIPAGSRYNTSGTAAELLNLSGRIPVIGDMMKGIANESSANTMAQAGPAAFGKQMFDPHTEEILRMIRRGSGLLAPAEGSAPAGLLGSSQ